jgi:hypothetical protein
MLMCLVSESSILGVMVGALILDGLLLYGIHNVSSYFLGSFTGSCTKSGFQIYTFPDYLIMWGLGVGVGGVFDGESVNSALVGLLPSL